MIQLPFLAAFLIEVMKQVSEIRTVGKMTTYFMVYNETKIVIGFL
ncbi:hypothetical protein [Neobacillus drentensis]|nr:hypothetical protein [Neobacillus drentensis]